MGIESSKQSNNKDGFRQHQVHPAKQGTAPVTMDYASTLKEQEAWGLKLSNSSPKNSKDQTNVKTSNNNNGTNGNSTFFLKLDPSKDDPPEKGVTDDVKKQYVPRLQKLVPIANFSRSTKERIIIGATDLKKSAHGAVKEFCGKTSAHGFSHIIEANSSIKLKMFWSLATITCLVAMLTVTYDATRFAFIVRRPHSEVAYKDNRTTGMRLPDITICSRGDFWKSKMAAYNVSTTMASYILIALRGVSVMSTHLATSAKSRRIQHMNLVEYLNSRGITLENLVYKISPMCTEVVLGCYTPKEQMHSRQCCDKMFRPVITSSGVCFTSLGVEFESVQQEIAGIMGGVKIILSNNRDEYMNYNPYIVSGLMMADTGVQVSLSFTTVTPTFAFNSHAVTVGPNVSASIALQTTTVDKTESYTDIWPWSPKQCITADELSAMTELERIRTEDNVYWAILYRDCPMELSNCTALPFRVENDTTAECLPDDLIIQSYSSSLEDCKKQLMTDSYRANSGTQLCLDTIVTQQLSYTTLDVSRVTNISISHKLAPSMVNIYHTQLSYTQYFERLPTFASWFSDLGGQMGLFMGASFITVIELIFMMGYVTRRSFGALLLRVMTWIGWQRETNQGKEAGESKQ